MPPPTEVRVMYADMEPVFRSVLLKHSFDEAKAAMCARIFADNSLDGVYTHGVNRFSRFIQMVVQKHVLPQKVPSKINAFGGMEQWNGNLGPGPQMQCSAQKEPCNLLMKME